MICPDLLFPIFQDSKQTIDVAFRAARGATLVTTTKRGSCQAFTGMSRFYWKTDVGCRSLSQSNHRGNDIFTFITFSLFRELFLSCSNNSVVFSKFDGKILCPSLILLDVFPDNLIYCESEELIFDRTIVSSSLIQSFHFVCDRFALPLPLPPLN